MFLTEVAQGSDGKLYNKVVRVIPQVPQTMGMDEAAFLALGPATRDNPSCP
jgi:branched-chain amino acid transport system substrate-binding protein